MLQNTASDLSEYLAKQIDQIVTWESRENDNASAMHRMEVHKYSTNERDSLKREE